MTASNSPMSKLSSGISAVSAAFIGTASDSSVVLQAGIRVGEGSG